MDRELIDRLHDRRCEPPDECQTCGQRIPEDFPSHTMCPDCLNLLIESE